MNQIKTTTIMFLLVTLIPLAGVASAAPLGTSFTYQGRLIDADKSADGLYDFQFKLFDADTGGNKVGPDVNMADIDVIDGYFTVELDFGNVFEGSARWLEIGVRPGDENDPNVYTTLDPRQKVTPAPYALKARGVSGMDNYNTLLGGGTGSAGTGNTLAGYLAGSSNTGNYNTFLGYMTGRFNTANYNIFLGDGAGYSNTSGYYNTFLGHSSGFSNTTGYGNTYMGYLTGPKNNSGHYNTFIGFLDGNNCASGVCSSNTFIGANAGVSCSTGYGNTFIGTGAGYNNNGHMNVFIGYCAGYFDTGSNDRLYIANDMDDSHILISGDFLTGRVGISLTDPTEALDVNGTARLRGIGGSVSAANVYVDTNGKLYKSTSSRRYKTNIENLNAQTDSVLNLRPVRFEYKETGQKDIGLIAEEVENISPDLVVYDNQNRPDAVKYEKVSLYLLSVVKELKAENESLRQRVDVLEKKINAKEARQ